MSQLLRKFSFDYARYTPQIWICAAVLWLVVLWATISSILSQPFTKGQRRFWLALVILLPLFGVLAYLPFSIPRDSLPQMLLLKRAKSTRRRTLAAGRGEKDA